MSSESNERRLREIAETFRDPPKGEIDFDPREAPTKVERPRAKSIPQRVGDRLAGLPVWSRVLIALIPVVTAAIVEILRALN